MAETPATATRRATPPPAARLGDRVRLLRVAAGLTQTELAGDRCSKEYVSQIERGKTRPTPETVEWLAERLNVDPAYLASGVSTDERGRVEALLARAEALSKAYRYKEAIDAYADVRDAVSATNSVELEVRTRSGEAWVRMQEGDVRTAVELLNGARALAEGPLFSDVDRAELVFRLGVCRYKLSSISTAVALAERGADAGRAQRDALRRAPLRHLPLALALLPPPARLRGGARGRRARARARPGRRRSPQDGRRVLPGVPGCRAHRPLGALAQLRREGEDPLPRARRRAHRRPAAEQPRRAQPPAREAAAGDRAAEGVVRGRRRGGLARPTPARP